MNECCIGCRKFVRVEWSMIFGAFVRKCGCGQRIVRPPVDPSVVIKVDRFQHRREERICAECGDPFMASVRAKAMYCPRPKRCAYQAWSKIKLSRNEKRVNGTPSKRSSRHPYFGEAR